MKILSSLLVPPLFASLGALAAPAAPAAEPLLSFESGAPAATHPTLYSFADLYRLTVAGGPFGGFRFTPAQAQIRVASQAAAFDAAEAPPELRFAVSAPRNSERWALLLAGVFACAWVAHRRLASPY